VVGELYTLLCLGIELIQGLVLISLFFLYTWVGFLQF
jgi:hypothetical protein